MILLIYIKYEKKTTPTKTTDTSTKKITNTKNISNKNNLTDLKTYLKKYIYNNNNPCTINNIYNTTKTYTNLPKNYNNRITYTNNTYIDTTYTSTLQKNFYLAPLNMYITKNKSISNNTYTIYKKKKLKTLTNKTTYNNNNTYTLNEHYLKKKYKPLSFLIYKNQNIIFVYKNILYDPTVNCTKKTLDTIYKNSNKCTINNTCTAKLYQPDLKSLSCNNNQTYTIN